ncbi:MAG: hypothetical protein M0Z66_10060 [Thermaerobacter sp.]|nr:hypothetical protein [Thermaerobacter sp.]
MQYTAIVTDDLFLGTKAQDILRRAGIAARRTAPGALDAADPAPAVVVLDLGLPLEKRVQVVHWAQDKAPVVAFGPHVDAESLFWARQAGCAAVLTKGQLEARLARAVAGALPADAPP